MGAIWLTLYISKGTLKRLGSPFIRLKIDHRESSTWRAEVLGTTRNCIARVVAVQHGVDLGSQDLGRKSTTEVKDSALKSHNIYFT